MNETQYLRLSLRERQKARAPRPYHTPGPVFTKPSPNPQRDQRTFWIEAGHGLRIKPTNEILEERHHTGWYIDQHQDETIRAYVIILPKRKGFLLAASDPCNEDCYQVENEVEHYTDNKHATALRHAARAAEQFTERLAEDYRDDAEHQTALHDQEEAEEERKASIARHRAQVEELESEIAEILDEAEEAQHPAPRARLHALAAQKRESAEQSRRLAQEREDADPPEEPTTPNFHYFGKVKR